MSDLLERYLSAVERRLPKEQAKDIVAELREVLTSKIEAAEKRNGRAATADDIAPILKVYGHPAVVASKYSGHDYLIGPGYYPWFWHVQRLVIGAAIAIAFAIVAVRALGSEEPIRAVFRGLGSAAQAALIAFAVVTALFVGAERTKLDMKFADRWDPKSLPRDHIRQPKNLLETAITLFFDVLVILFWLKVVQFPNEIPVKGEGAAGMFFSPAWAQVYWPILVLMLGATAIHVADLFHPAWSRLRAVVAIAGYVGGLAVLWVLFRSQPLVEVVAVNGADQIEVDRVFRSVEGIINIPLAITGLVWAIAAGFEVWRFWKSGRPSAGPSPLPAT